MFWSKLRAIDSHSSQPLHQPDQWESLAYHENFKFKKIQPSQVYRLLSGLKNGKESGIDKIPNRILKQSKDIITPALTEMFNIFIQFNIFPYDLKLARVSPIFKDGDAEELGNYRPISIISAIARIFKKLIYNQLIEFLQRNEVLGNHQ